MRSNKAKDIVGLQGISEKEALVQEKFDELISLLSQIECDSEAIRHLQHRLSKTIEKKQNNAEIVKAFKAIDKKGEITRDELLDEFSMLLSYTKIDSRIASNYLRGERVNKVVLMLIGVMMIVLGFAMIIMPAPPYFEMFTIYYFNQDDGVTLMDLISLTIVLSGIYLFLRTIYKNQLFRLKHG
jgi:hypothetical protein